MKTNPLTHTIFQRQVRRRPNWGGGMGTAASVLAFLFLIVIERESEAQNEPDPTSNPDSKVSKPIESPLVDSPQRQRKLNKVGVDRPATSADSIVPSDFTQRKPKKDASRPFRENATLPVDSNLLKRFGTVEDLLADQRWNEAIGMLQEIEQTADKSLVLVQPGKVGGVATYLNVTTRCNVLLSRVSAEGRTAYRQKVDPQAKRWIENWQRTRDEAELLRIVRQTFLSRYGDDALLALGEVAWDRGDFSAARLWWEQLIPLANDANPAHYPTVLRYPDTDIDRASILARIVMCSILANEPVRATDELRQFAERYPLAEGWMAGQQGRFLDLLQRTLDDLKRWKPTNSAAEVATFGQSPERYRRIPEPVDVGALRWVRPLTPRFVPPPIDRLPLQSDPLSYHPVVYDNLFDKIVFVNDSDTIRAWNILTGEPAWRSEGHDPAVIYPLVLDEPTLAPDKVVGEPHYTMTIADDRLYARMGSPVTCSSNAELRRDPVSDLVCLDLTQEGKLVWKIASQELLPDDTPWRYEGTPVVIAGRAYVALCRRHPQLELIVACLDALDGRLIWQRPIGAFRASVDDSKNRISHLLLTAGGGRVFLSTDVGAIVALDAQDGRLEWAISYESRSEESLATFSDRSFKSLRPALYHAGLLFVAPSDANSAFCIEADSGRIHWIFSYLEEGAGETTDALRRNIGQLREWRHLLGVAPGGSSGRLIVSGTALWAIDIETGKIAWTGNDGVSGRGGRATFGRGLIADEILLPTRESIEFFDLRTGARVRSVPLKTSDSDQQGGNLTLAGGMLLVAQPHRLAAYWEFSRLKERIENELTQRPNDQALRVQMAELDAAEGQRNAAVTELRGVLERTNPADPACRPARQKLTKLLHEMGSSEIRESKTADARDHWREALSIASDVTTKVDLLFNLARAEVALDHPEAALAQLQQILNNERLASVRRDYLTAGHDAAREMSRVIAEHGRTVYREIESAASSELDALTQVADRRGLHQLAEKYPHAKATAGAQKLLMQQHRDAGEILEACAILNEMRRDVTDDRAFVEATLSMIELLEAGKARNSATEQWKTLAAHQPSMEVVFAGTKYNLQELASARLGQDAARHRSQPAFVERAWSYGLPSDNRIIVPALKPPSEELAVVFICSRHPQQSNLWLWQCLNWRTGQTRWEEIASSAIQTVVWTPFRILIGTNQGWQARTAETGRRVWEPRSLVESTPLFVQQLDGTVWPALFNVDQGMQLLDPNDGQIVAILKPPGRLHYIVGIGNQSFDKNPIDRAIENSGNSDRSEKPVGTSGQMKSPIVVLMQTLNPTRVWRAAALSPRDRWSIEEFSKGGELWQHSPFTLQNRLIGMTSNHHLVGYELENTHPNAPRTGDLEKNGVLRRPQNWNYSNFSVGSGDPIALAFQNELLLIVDGTRLASFDAVTGTRKWSTGLVDFPLKDPALQVCAADGCVFGTSQGKLRCISIEDGFIRWEHYLGNTSAQWKTTVVWDGQPETNDSRHPISSNRRRSLIAAWPLDPFDNARHPIWLCNSETGAIVQQLQAELEPRGITLDFEGRGILWTDKSLSGLRFSSSKSVEISKSGVSSRRD